MRKKLIDDKIRFEKNLDVKEWQKQQKKLAEEELARLYKEKANIEWQIEQIENSLEKENNKYTMKLDLINTTNFKVLGK